jgi:alkylmercury lyase
LYVLRTLAKGKPVTQANIAGALGMSLGAVQAALTVFKDIEYNDAGNIVASGLSLTPTPHCFQVNGQDLFTWCALDALMYPVALQQTARVESLCPVTGLAVRLTVTPTGVTFLDPAGAVVSIVIPAAQAGCCTMRNAFCNQVHFINSPQAADAWRSLHPEATILSVEEAWHLGHAIARRRLADEQSAGTSVT